MPINISFPSPKPLPGKKKDFPSVSARINSFGDRKAVSKLPAPVFLELLKNPTMVPNLPTREPRFARQLSKNLNNRPRKTRPNQRSQKRRKPYLSVLDLFLLGASMSFPNSKPKELGGEPLNGVVRCCMWELTNSCFLSVSIVFTAQACVASDGMVSNTAISH
ncbi:hypothetical protein OUZ56_002359 [Daphnia magna]|uniref:Uncharacterized protein n=1 Tax=Daphnia magna TaxID=35525 RepID=A0ABR0A5F3_9CRUS|nr:hypothetical protein OUZ56_002359 [Daphnia magna]